MIISAGEPGAGEAIASFEKNRSTSVADGLAGYTPAGDSGDHGGERE